MLQKYSIMKIKYLKSLEENKTDPTGWACESIDLAGIADLEVLTHLI